MKDIQIGDFMKINTKDEVFNINGVAHNGKEVLVMGLLKHLRMAEVQLLDTNCKFYVPYEYLEKVEDPKSLYECYCTLLDGGKTSRSIVCQDVCCQVSKFLDKLKSQGWDIKSFAIDMYKDGRRVEISHKDVATK